MKEKRNWSPVRTLIRFQLRLMLDALRDFILSPASFVCILLDIVTGKKNKEQSTFYALMLVGRDSDRWINLFEQFDEDGNEISIGKDPNEKQVQGLNKE